MNGNDMIQMTEKEAAAFEEFKRRPVGQHSAYLQKIVNKMRGGSVDSKYVLFCTKPHEEWVLAKLNGRAKPITIYWDKVFKDLRAAEIEIYKLRWPEVKDDVDHNVT